MGKDKMMKTFKKLIAVFITLVMSLSMMNLAVFAEGNDDDEVPAPEYDYPLTVTSLKAGDVAHFYQVIEWVGDAEGNVAGWKAKTPFDTYLTEERLTAILVGTPAAGETPATPPTGITSEIAGELAKLANGEGSVVPAAGAGDSKTATLQNAAAGMWMALIDPADANTVYNPVFVSADFNKTSGGTVAVTDKYNGDAVAKSSTLQLVKTAATAEDTWDDKKPNTTAVGDTVTFTVATTIPAYGFVYENPHFVLKDKLTDLVLKADTENPSGYAITVRPATYVDGGEQKATYTIVVDDDKKGYTITFAEGYLKTLTAAADITVAYDAIVTDTAAKAVNEEDNDVYIEYSHDPQNQRDYDVKKDTTQHYTFSIDAEGAGEGSTVSGKKTSEVVKVGVKPDGTPITETTVTSEITKTETWTGPLAGAVFGLFTDAQCKNAYIAKNSDGTDGTEPMTATTGEDGRMNFKGLDAGTYYLKEISAPAGFVTSPAVHTIVIAAETEKINVTEFWTGSEWVSAQSEDLDNPYKSVTYETEVLKKYTVTIDGVATATYTFTNQKDSNTNEINWETATLVEKPAQIENPQGVELPSTGGIGTTIFYVVGTLLVVGAGIVLVARRKASE